MLSKTYVFFIILFLLLFASETINAQSENIKNGGFETGNLSPWIYVGAGPEAPTWIVTNTESYNGSYSLQIGGFTLCIVKQEFSPPVLASGVLSFWVLIPPVINPCDPFDPYCMATPGFTLSVEYSSSQQNYNLISQLTGSGWKKIDIPMSQSDEIKSIVFSTAEISSLYIDNVSLPSVSLSSFPWPVFLPVIINNNPNPSPLEPAFERSSSGNVVTDIKTGFMWQDSRLSFQDEAGGIIYCDQESLDGYDDWRLPTVSEIQDFFKRVAADPSFDLNNWGTFSGCTANVAIGGYVKTPVGAEQYGGNTGDTINFVGGAAARCVR